MALTRFSYQQLQVMTRVATHLAVAEDLRKALSLVLEWLEEECDMKRGVIALMREGGDEVQADITAGTVPPHRHGRMRYRPGEGITGQVFATGRPVFLPNLESSDFLDRSGLRQGLDPSTTAFFCAPITYRGDVIGTLSVDQDARRVDNPEVAMAYLMEVAQLLAPFVQRRRLEDRFEIFHKAKQPGGAFDKLIGKSSVMQELQNLIVRIADTRTTVLITGETGTGKGVVAELIHELGPSQKEPFVEVNCGAIPENLIESELFGHEKGAFTGATQRRVGVVERARGGTVFLDEIGELPLNAQTRLLRVLQTREFERVGGSQTLRSSARIVAATNRDLESDVSLGTFRADLYYRLNVFPIHVPPLRERGKADVMLMVDYFIQRFCHDLGKRVHRIDTPAIDMLTAYHWPGNVRELENVLERAILLADGDVIHGHHLPPSLQMNRYADHQETHDDFTSRVQAFEVELITEALKDTNGNQTKAAKKLGITKRMIQYKIANYSIDYKRFK